MRVVRRLLIMALVVALAAAAAAAARPGDPAPDIRLPRLGGGTVDMGTLLSGGPVVVWFPDVATARRAPALQSVVTAAGGSLLVVPVVGQDGSAAAELAGGMPGTTFLHDADGSVTLGYAGEFVPGVSPRQNLFVVNPRGQISCVRYWPGVSDSTLTAEVRAAR